MGLAGPGSETDANGRGCSEGGERSVARPGEDVDEEVLNDSVQVQQEPRERLRHLAVREMREVVRPFGSRPSQLVGAGEGEWPERREGGVGRGPGSRGVDNGEDWVSDDRLPKCEGDDVEVGGREGELVKPGQSVELLGEEQQCLGLGPSASSPISKM